MLMDRFAIGLVIGFTVGYLPGATADPGTMVLLCTATAGHECFIDCTVGYFVDVDVAGSGTGKATCTEVVAECIAYPGSFHCYDSSDPEEVTTAGLGLCTATELAAATCRVYL